MIDDLTVFPKDFMEKELKEGKAEYINILPDDKAYVRYKRRDYLFDKKREDYISLNMLLKFYER